MPTKEHAVAVSLAKQQRPLMWANQEETACLCGMGVAKFKRIRPRLEAKGFPRPHKITGKWYIPRILAFWDLEARRQMI